MRNFLGLIYGIVYGVALVAPGLSGGTFLVIFGCYDLICEAFALNIKEIKKHFFFLLFFGIGTVLGVIGFVYAITYLLASFAMQTNLFFLGIILGGIPLIIKIATEEEKFKPVCIAPFILGLASVLSLFFLEKFNVFGVNASKSVDFIFFAIIIVYSFIAAIAMVMPGISGAFILMVFGVYDMYMNAMKELDFMILIPAGIGVLLGIVVGSKLILFLMKKFKLIAYSVIIGMVIGSVAPLFPEGLGLNIATLTGVACLILGAWITVILGKKENT